jgi:hypothetical protein
MVSVVVPAWIMGPRRHHPGRSSLKVSITLILRKAADDSAAFTVSSAIGRISVGADYGADPATVPVRGVPVAVA